MFLVKEITSQLLSSVWDKVQTTTSHNHQREMSGITNPAFDLWFHPVRGKAITFEKNFTEAKRNEDYFEHAVVFSERPINVNEVVAIKVTETSFEFHGPLRIGFTNWNPNTWFDRDVPLGRDLKDTPGFWLKSVQLHPINVGTTLFFKVDQNGSVLYGVDGKSGGVFLKGVNVSEDFWMVAEAYGAVRAISLVKKSMVLTYKDELLLHEQPQQPRSLQLNRSPRPVLTASRQNLIPAPLYERRNLVISPLAPPNTPSSPNITSPRTPFTPAFVSPAPEDEFHHGLCIICADREKNTAFTKCGHLCMCFPCAESYKNQTTPGPTRSRQTRRKNLCPVCRQPITSILRIYT